MLTKKQRGRLKKLRKRAAVACCSETSGLTNASDWNEWQELMMLLDGNDSAKQAADGGNDSKGDTDADPHLLLGAGSTAATRITLGPTVRLRRRRKHNDDGESSAWQKADAHDHRDILWTMVQQYLLSSLPPPVVPLAAAAARKRKRDRSDVGESPAFSLPSRIPPWCTLHNPCTVESVAVVELCLHETCTLKDVQQHLPILSLHDKDDYDAAHHPHQDEKHAKNKVVAVLPIETRWFQGNDSVPKSPTNVLMYHSTPSSCKHSLKQRNEGKLFSSKKQLLDDHAALIGRLQELVLSKNCQRKEGFPIMTMPTTSEDASLSPPPPPPPPPSEQHSAVCNNHVAVTNAPPLPPLPSTKTSLLPPLEEAKRIVQGYSVPSRALQVTRNGEQCDEEEDDDDEVTPFVMASSGNNRCSSSSQAAHECASPVEELPAAVAARVFALDCEMVKSARGIELARVTLLQLTPECFGANKNDDDDKDVSYKVVLDEFVQPYDTILDYATKYSGITAAILKGVTTRIEQVQAALISILNRCDILVGHSLENDLLALRLVHDQVVDTAMLFRSKKGRKHCKLAAMACSSHQFCNYPMTPAFTPFVSLLFANTRHLHSAHSTSTFVVRVAWQKDPVQSWKRRTLQRRGRSRGAPSGGAPCNRGTILSSQ